MDDYVGDNTIQAEPNSGQPSSNDNPDYQENPKQQFLNEVKAGLSGIPKTLPCKYFYDQKGSELFEKICQLDEYYITRTELQLLTQIETELTELIGKNAVIIEPGAGAGIKIRKLLSALDSPRAYVPMDISEDFLFYSAEIIQNKFPEIEILPIEGDFTQHVEWQGMDQYPNRVVFFPGSTIGNFEKSEAIDFLKNMYELVGKNGALIVGADLLKDRATLEAAYDDSLGVTARFNKNLLLRINNELDGNFNLQQFTHQARLNHQQQRIEMHLVSDKTQQVEIAQETFKFDKGESIHTENSHKYTLQSFTAMAEQAGFRSLKTWTDEQNYFSIHYLVRD